VTARQVDGAATRLRDLRAQAADELALAAAALLLAVASTRLYPSLAIPLLLAGATVTFLGLRALVRRTFLLEDLALDADAYAIPDVRRYAVRAAAPEHRRALAGSLRAALSARGEGLAQVRCELRELIPALEDERVAWEPRDVVALERWLHDAGAAVPAGEARAHLRALLASLAPQDQ
jgi:hypothetical protein